MSPSSAGQENLFALKAAHDEALYTALASRENVLPFKEALQSLASISRECRVFWNGKSSLTTPHAAAISAFELFLYRLMRSVLGVTLTAKYILGRKEERVQWYKTYCVTCTVDEDYKIIDEFAERLHGTVGGIEEKRVKFFSNVVLGFNDALIELTGALVGFSFALRESKLILLAGLITGVSASLSMAASAYQQARHEDGRNPVNAAFFTGLSYLSIAFMLVLPFMLISDPHQALMLMGGFVALMIVVFSFYSAILRDRRYVAQLIETALFSVGVAAIAFVIGHVLSIFIGIS